MQREVSERLHRTPHHAQLPRSRWWLDGVRQAVAAFADYSLPAVWRWLRRWQLRYKRGRQWLHSPDPDYDLKLAYIQAALGQAQRQPHQVAVWYMDELTYYRRPSVARAYAPRGHHQQRAAVGETSNRKRRVAACLNALTGATFSWQRAQFDTATQLRFYRALQAAYPHLERMFIVLDNWPPHFHPDILLGLQGSTITLLRLPTYAPWTNPIEKLWLRLKQEVLHLHPFADDWQGLQAAVQAWLDSWQHPSEDLLRYCGLSP